ncbi:MAG: hypothetical protein CL790_06665 [Chloroflexi bacterium]|nr:hypothetical protein [Chloroflexota bacterium]|tara:strand:+ start:451 stop:1734 length:1284 start_codon:yes stop_codon:yes gene_type:complete
MTIAYFFIPSFALTCAIITRPQLIERPVVLADQVNLRVAEATTPALQSGVQIGMPLHKATARCPTLLVLEQQPARITHAAKRLSEAVAQVSPFIEELAPGEMLIDLIGLKGLYPNIRSFATALNAAIPDELQLFLGVAEERFTAITAAHTAKSFYQSPVLPPVKSVAFQSIFDSTNAPTTAIELGANWIQVVSGKSAEFLADRSAQLLPLEIEALQQLALLGIQTIGEFAHLPRQAIAAQFGMAGDRAWLAATGNDPTPISPRPISNKGVIEHIQMESPLVSRDAVARHARLLLQRAKQQPQASNRSIRFIRLRAVTDRDRSWEKTQILHEPTEDLERLFIVLHTLIEYSKFPGPVAELELELGGLTVEQGHQSKFSLTHKRQNQHLEEMVKQLQIRFGRSLVTQIVEVESSSRLPERRFALMDYDP